MVKPPSSPSDDKAEKEARLAAALRANLRRRKAAARNPAKGGSAPKARDEPAKD